MSLFLYIILFTVLGSIISLVGGIILLTREKFAIKISHFLSSFAAGALLGTAFFDLLPEAAEEAAHVVEEGLVKAEANVFLWTLIGLLTFFLLERFIHWFHHHGSNHEKDKKSSLVTLVTVGDGIHNFIDGIAIATTFLVSVPLGIITAFAVAAHEIPQEIGDFGVLLHRGVKKSKVLFLNLISAVMALIGAIIAYFAAESIEGYLPIILSLTAGFFIYIAASDLIPEIHNEEKRKVAMVESGLLLLGVLTIWILVQVLSGFAGH